MRRLSALDAQFLAAERASAGSHYCGLAIYDTTSGATIDAGRLRQLVAARLGNLPPLRWKLTTVPFGLDHPVFVDVNVDLAEHISEMTLPPGADDAALGGAVAAILSTPLDRTRPLWKMTVVHGLAGRTAIITTLHHAAMDGIAAGELFSELHDICGAVPEAPRPSAWTPEKPPSQLGLAVRGVAALPGRPVRAVRSIARSLGHLDQVPVLRSLPGVHRTASTARGEVTAARLDAPRMRFNTRLSGARMVAFGTVSFDEVRVVKRRFGVSVNDVVVALCAGALRRRLLATGDLPDSALVAYLPVSTRLPDAEDRYGNAISSIIAPIPTHLASAGERVVFANEWLHRAKRRAKAAPPTLLADVNEPVPAPVFGFFASSVMDLISSTWVRPPVNLIISNVPGSPAALEAAGAPLRGHYPLSLVFDGFAVNVTVVSYRDSLDIGIVGDARALPDAWELVDDFRAELAEMSASTVAKGDPDL